MRMPRALPPDMKRILNQLLVGPRLAAHLALVHDAAFEIVTGLTLHFPDLKFDYQAVLCGAATHDVGKVLHPNELTGPGKRHEEDGPALLERYGVASHLARFCRTHGAWDKEPLELEDLLVALADTAWKGQRIDTLESLIVTQIARGVGKAEWEVFSTLDELVTAIAENGDERLEYQRQHG
ncbi:MAG: HD domain-containing protein [Planctomycetota bacterium]